MATTIKYGAPFPFGINCTNPIYDIDPNKGPYESEADAMAVFPPTLREVGRAIGIYTDTTKRSVKVYNWEKNASDAWVLVPQSGEITLTHASIVNALGYTPMSTTHASFNVTTTRITNWDSAYTNNHTHGNKAILDATTASYTNADKTKLDGLNNYELTQAKINTALGYTPMSTTHASFNVTTTRITNWDLAYTNNHTHGNKSTLDTITAQRMLGWDGKMDKVTENGNIVKVLGLDAENNAKNAEVVDIIGIWDSNTAPTEQQLIESFPDALFVYAVAITPRVMYLKAGVEWKKVNLTDI